VPKKKLSTEPEIHICSFCNTEIIGSFEYTKTKRGSEIYICRNCLPKNMKTN
jgi:predicted SprT family Zn-dependent metalloprotease